MIRERLDLVVVALLLLLIQGFMDVEHGQRLVHVDRLVLLAVESLHCVEVSGSLRLWGEIGGVVPDWIDVIRARDCL